MESVRLDQIPLQVQSKSGEVILKQQSTRLTSLPDFCWTYKGRKEVKYKKSLVHQTSQQS